MSKLIEVEIENKSYIKLLDLEKQKTNTLKLTTLKDNQSAVIIKVFLNKLDERILIKEFHVRNLKPKVSGLPRFELGSSYSNKILNLELKVDGRKVETSEIKLSSYLRNKFLPLLIILGLIAVFLLFAGGKWLFSSVIITETQTTRNRSEVTKNENTGTETKRQIETVYEKTNQTDTKIEIEKVAEEPVQSGTQTGAEIITVKPAPIPVKNTEDSSVTQTTLHIAYFTPNNTSIQKDAASILKILSRELINTPNASVEISGYCAMTGTEEGRERLSKERAYNVLNYLKKEGWIPEIDPVIKWYGGERPVTSDQNEIYRNRRVEIKIVSQ